MKMTSTSIMYKDRSFSSIMKAVLNYMGALALKYGISLAEPRIKDIAHDMIPSRYLLRQSRSSHVGYVRSACLMKKNYNALPLLEFLNESREDGKEIGISHLNSVKIHATRVSFFDLLVKRTEFYIDNQARSTAFHAFSFSQFFELFPLMLYVLHGDFSKELKSSLLLFINKKLATIMDEQRPINYLYLENM